MNEGNKSTRDLTPSKVASAIKKKKKKKKMKKKTRETMEGPEADVGQDAFLWFGLTQCFGEAMFALSSPLTIVNGQMWVQQKAKARY